MENFIAEKQALHTSDIECGHLSASSCSSVYNDEEHSEGDRTSGQLRKTKLESQSSSVSFQDSEMSRDSRKNNHKCAIVVLLFITVIFLLSCVGVLSALLYSEKMSTDLLMNELYSQSQLLECLSQQPGWGLCPRHYQPALRCTRRISLDCSQIE